MSVNISNYYSADTQGVREYAIDRLPNAEACKVVADTCTSDARNERLGAIAKGVMAAGTSLALIAVAYAVAVISTVLVGAMFFPLAIIPPVYNVITVVGGVGAGTAFAYYSIRRTGAAYLSEAKAHWANANHYYNQATDAKLRKAELLRAG